MSNEHSTINLIDILVKPTSKVLEKYDAPTEFTSYSNKEIREQEVEMAEEFRQMNQGHVEAQKSTLKELDDVIV